VKTQSLFNSGVCIGHAWQRNRHAADFERTLSGL
jgi:hypothetical protein